MSRETDGPVYRPGWAVVVGVNNYDEFTRLTGSVRNAIGVYALLTHPQHTNLDPQHVYLLLDGHDDEIRRDLDKVVHIMSGHHTVLREGFADEVVRARHPPTLEMILATAKKVAQNARPDDLVFAYFSGHGQVVDQQLLLIPPHAKLVTLAGTAIRRSEIEQYLEGSAARDKVLLLNICYAGHVSGPRRSAMGPGPRNVATLASSLPSEHSFEEELTGYSAFNAALFEGWTGQADRAGVGYVTLSDLAEFVTDHVKTWFASKHRFDPSQTPNLNDAGARCGRRIILSGKARTESVLITVDADGRSDCLTSWTIELESLQQHFDSHSRAALTGEPGCGKTTIARQFLNHQVQSEHKIFLECQGLDAKTCKTLKDSLDGLAFDNADNASRAVLIVLDGVVRHKTLADIERVILDHPRLSSAMVRLLVTSSISNLRFQDGGPVPPFRVRNFSSQASERLLGSSSAKGVTSRALALAHRMERSPAVVTEIAGWLTDEHSDHAGLRAALGTSRLQRSTLHVARAIRSLRPSERRLLRAAAACAGHDFWLPLAWSVGALENHEEGPKARDQLVARSLLHVLDQDRQRFRLPPLVRAYLRGDGQFRRVRRRHATVVGSMLKEGRTLEERRHALYEVPEALDWLRESAQVDEAIRLWTLAFKELGILNSAEQDIVEQLEAVRSAEPRTRKARHRRHARSVLSRLRWSEVIRYQAAGFPKKAYNTLLTLKEIYGESGQRWWEQVCCGMLAHLALANPDFDNEHAIRETTAFIKERETICTSKRLWPDLVWCLGDQVVFSFLSDKPEDVHRRVTNDEVERAAALLARQVKVARRTPYADWLPSAHGNLTLLNRAIGKWRAEEETVNDPRRESSPAGVSSSAVRMRRRLHILFMLLSILRSGLGRRDSSDSRSGPVEEVNTATFGSDPVLDALLLTSYKDSGPEFSSESDYHDLVALRLELPDQCQRFRVVSERLIKDWLSSTESASALNEWKERVRTRADAAAAEGVVAILSARGEFKDATDFLDSQERTALAQDDLVALAAARAQRATVVAREIEAHRAQASTTRSRARLRILRRQELVLDDELSAFDLQLTFQITLAHWIWTWGALGGALGDTREASQHLQRAVAAFEQLRMDKELAFARQDLEKVQSRAGADCEMNPGPIRRRR